MCTVSFIPWKGKTFICSNRDEKTARIRARQPLPYHGKTGTIVYPKDRQAAGTWIAVHENGNAVVLLNGAWTNHTRRKSYRQSRGLVLLALIDSENPLQGFHETDLEGIEPFTAIIFQDQELFECKWHEPRKAVEQLDATVPHLWSSVTLYDEKVSAKRQAWFEAWLVGRRYFSLDEVLQFHQQGGDGDVNNDLLMNRPPELRTVSITAMEIMTVSGAIKYLDLLHNRSYLQQLRFTKSTVSP